MPLILLVEDNEMNADMLLRRLQRRGFATAWRRNGIDALHAVAALQPALILMDLNLPDIDGYAASRLLKHGDHRHIPIIALTAHALAGDREQALAAGCDDYETKPIVFPRLIAKINQLLPRPDARPE